MLQPCKHTRVHFVTSSGKTPFSSSADKPKGAQSLINKILTKDTPVRMLVTIVYVSDRTNLNQANLSSWCGSFLHARFTQQSNLLLRGAQLPLDCLQVCPQDRQLRGSCPHMLLPQAAGWAHLPMTQPSFRTCLPTIYTAADPASPGKKTQSPIGQSIFFQVFTLCRQLFR
jgi:hypothetical protein